MTDTDLRLHDKTPEQILGVARQEIRDLFTNMTRLGYDKEVWGRMVDQKIGELQSEACITRPK